MANEFVIKNGYFSQGNSNITGSLTVTGGVTASLQGTASFAVTASYAINAATASFLPANGTYNITASWSNNSITASYYAETDPLFTSKSGSFVTTASFNSFTASYATGSFTGSFTGVLTGTASYANYALSSSYAITSSYANFSLTSSYSATASIALSSLNASDVLIYVKNVTGATINKGTVVRISGATGDNALIATASYEADNNSANTLGILNETIVDQAFGYVMTEGKLLGIDTSAFTAGQLLFLGPTGSIIGYDPQAPLHAVRLGQALRIQQNNGSMYVRIDNGYELDELHNVLIISGSDGDLLVASGSNGNGKKLYINSKQLTGSYAITGSLTANLFVGSLTGTASYAANSNLLDGLDSTVFTSTSSFNSFTSSYTTGSFTGSFNGIAAGLTGVISSSYAITSSYSANSQLLNGSDSATFATTGSNIFKNSQTITGSLTITNDLIVLGSSSIQYITSSQLNIADNIITVNTITPAIRFGGLAVNDSGSVTPRSGSLLFDSEQNQWLFVHQDGSGAVTSSLLIMAAETYNNIGNETHPTTNRIMKSINDEHIGDSNITDTGTVVSINSNTEITGSVKITNSLTVGGTIIGNGGMSMSGSNSVTGSLIITGSTSANLVRITQTGTGNAFVVEDSTNPDSSAFVIDSSGRVGVGTTLGSIYGHFSVDTTTVGGNAIYGTSPTIGVYAYAPTAVKGESTIIGVHGKTENDTVATGTGVWGQATYTGENVPPLTNIGGKFQADSATNNYALQLIDGTETITGRFLINQTTDGKANWGKTIPDIQITNAITGSTGNNTNTDAMIQASLLYLSNNC